MVLAEALQERSDINYRLRRIEERICSNVTVQEGEKPLEDPKELIGEMEDLFKRYNMLVSAINLTNCKTVVDGKTLTEWLSDRDTFKTKVSMYQEILRNASNISDRARQTEIKILASIDVRSLQKELDLLSKKLRLIDNKIQNTNWNTEILI